MSTKQTQEVANNALAIQSSRDTVATINIGMNPEEVQKTIHSALQAAMPMFTQVAQFEAGKRMAELEQKVMERLASQGTTSAEALKDPDFQYMLTRAHHLYARSGDPQIADTLVDLIGHRASQTDRSRLTLTLNDAVDKTALLTKNEFASLSLVYTLKQTKRTNIGNFLPFLEWLEKSVLVFVPDISDEETSYLYLQALSCTQINPLARLPLRTAMCRYAGVLSKGFDPGAFEKSRARKIEAPVF